MVRGGLALLCLSAAVIRSAADVYVAPLSRRLLSPNETRAFHKARRRLGDKETLYQLEPLYGSVRDNGCACARPSQPDAGPARPGCPPSGPPPGDAPPPLRLPEASPCSCGVAPLDSVPRRRRRRVFTVNINFGTPPQLFDVIVDTGSTLAYVPCSNCGAGCGSHEARRRPAASPSPAPPATSLTPSSQTFPPPVSFPGGSPRRRAACSCSCTTHLLPSGPTPADARVRPGQEHNLLRDQLRQPHLRRLLRPLPVRRDDFSPRTLFLPSSRNRTSLPRDTTLRRPPCPPTPPPPRPRRPVQLLALVRRAELLRRAPHPGHVHPRRPQGARGLRLREQGDRGDLPPGAGK